MMRSLVAKIFICSVLVQILTRAAWVALMVIVAEPHPGPARQLQQVLPLYGELAATALETGGPVALAALTRRVETDNGLTIDLLVDAGPCVAKPVEPGEGLSLSYPVSHGDAHYCLQAESVLKGRPWHWGDVMLPLELAICGVFSFLLARYLLQPIRTISNAAQALGRGDLTARAGPKLGRRRDEAGELVRQFDRMADRIALLIQAQQRFIGDVSHEIKSPLARISMALGLARREAGLAAAPRFDRIERELDTISQLISELLTLSSLQAAGVTRAFVPVDLVGLVEAIVEDAAFERPDRHVRLIGAAAAVTVSGDATLLRRAVENVLRNALFYTPPGTAVEVAVAAADDGTASITVRDYGPGVPAAALDHLFEPFYRVDEARARNTGGIGIGLAICDRAVRLHGGQVTADNLAPSGLSIRIVLPRCATDAGQVDAPDRHALLALDPSPAE